MGFGVGPGEDVFSQPQRTPVFEQNKAIRIIAGCLLLCPEMFYFYVFKFLTLFFLLFWVRKGFSTLIIVLILPFGGILYGFIFHVSKCYSSVVKPKMWIQLYLFLMAAQMSQWVQQSLFFPVDSKSHLSHVGMRSEFKRWDILGNTCTAASPSSAEREMESARKLSL